MIIWRIPARFAGLRFHPGFWKKSFWNERGDYMEKISARAENVHPGLESWKTSCNRSKLSVRVETSVWAGAKQNGKMAQRNKMAAMEKLCLNLGWNSPCNRNKISARGAGWNSPCNHPLNLIFPLYVFRIVVCGYSCPVFVLLFLEYPLTFESFRRDPASAHTSFGPLQSTIRKKMAPYIAFWVDWPVGPKFSVFVWESDGK